MVLGCFEFFLNPDGKCFGWSANTFAVFSLAPFLPKFDGDATDVLDEQKCWLDELDDREVVPNGLVSAVASLAASREGKSLTRGAAGDEVDFAIECCKLLLVVLDKVPDIQGLLREPGGPVVAARSFAVDKIGLERIKRERIPLDRKLSTPSGPYQAQRQAAATREQVKKGGSLLAGLSLVTGGSHYNA